MTEAKTVLKKWPKLSYVPRRSTVAPQKVKPIPIEQYLPSISNISEPISRHLSPESSQKNSVESQQTDQTTVQSSDDNKYTQTQDRTSTPIIKTPSPVLDKIETATEKGQSSNSSKRCFNRLTPKQKTFFKLLTILLLIIGASAAVLPPVYMFVIRRLNQESSFTNITASTCSATTCIGKETPYRTSMTTVLYPFDGGSNDLSGYAIGTPFGAALIAYSSSSYVGSNSLSLSSASSQYIQIPYVNLAQSFTIEVWVYPSGALVDYGILGQCDSNFKCLSISIRNSRFTLSFDSMNTTNNTLVGSTYVNTGEWMHLAVVYDAVLDQQQIYANGRIDSITSGMVAAFGGTSSGSITTIGRTLSSAYGTSYYQGRMDHFTISAGAVRTACQLYNDASLVAYYPFDSTATFSDRSVNLFHGIALGTTTISEGRFEQALYFSSNASFFQAECFPNMETATISLSIALWIKPDNTTSGGSLVHISSLQNGSGNCFDLLAFSSSGNLVVQLMQTTSIVNGIRGPIIPANTWTHLTVVYGATNGLRIYINGQLSIAYIGITQGQNGVADPQFITLGNNNPTGQSTLVSCRNGTIPIVPGPYKGVIDEFRLYNRELNNQEICVLAGL